MFQYALYLQLKALGKDVKIDDVEGFILDKQRKPVLTDTFGITYDKADKQDIIEITDAHMDLISRIRRKLFGRHSTEYLDETGNFDPKIFEMDTAYLNGYFQSDKYFPDKEVIDILLDKQRVTSPVSISHKLFECFLPCYAHHALSLLTGLDA